MAAGVVVLRCRVYGRIAALKCYLQEIGRSNFPVICRSDLSIDQSKYLRNVLKDVDERHRRPFNDGQDE